MKRAAAGVAFMMLIVGYSGSASAQQHAWCSVTHHGARSCGFATHRQCITAIHGVGGHCIRNPRH
jgi:hypothetical protein